MTADALLGKEIAPDRADAPCAACGCSTQFAGGARRGVSVNASGKTALIMLCNNAEACASRFRHGLTPEQYACELRIAIPGRWDWS